MFDFIFALFFILRVSCLGVGLCRFEVVWVFAGLVVAVGAGGRVAAYRSDVGFD